MKPLVIPSLLVMALLGLALSGCGSNKPTSSTEPAGSESSETQVPDTPEHGTAGQSDMEKMKANLAKLEPADAATAEKQHMCPVSGEMLGTMGVPIKVTVGERTVWICCDGCRDKLLADPDKYFAKLPQ